MTQVPCQAIFHSGTHSLFLITDTWKRAHPGLVGPAEQVKGSQEFYQTYRKLKPGSVERRIVDSALDKLKHNMMAREKIRLGMELSRAHNSRGH